MAEDPGSKLIRLGSVTLDLSRGTLIRDGHIVPLRSKSFRLLCELATQPGRVMSKQELLDAVWSDVTVTEASLSQAVHDIRRALGDEAGQVLRTVARRGFMLCPTEPPRDTSIAPPAAHSLAAGRPRIAVLPLTDRTGTPDHGPILEALAEEVTAGLARFRNLTVVARHSAFAAARSLGPAELGAKLRADYVVDGTARVVDRRLMLAMALNDVESGEMLWGESFVCEGSGWLTLQDLIPRRIVQRLFTSVEEAGYRSSLRRNAATLSAFEHLARGRALFRSFEPGVNEQAHAHFAAAMEADPSLGVAHSYFALTDLSLHDYDLALPEVKQRARAQAQRGVQLSPDESRCHGILSFIHLWNREFHEAEETARRAVALNPCDADGLFNMGNALMCRGRAQESLEWFERAKDINPMWPAYYDVEHSWAFFHLDRHEEAVETLSRVPRRTARQEMRLAASYALLGKRDLARVQVERATSRAPGLDFVELARVGYPFEQDSDLRRIIDGIRLALAITGDTQARRHHRHGEATRMNMGSLRLQGMHLTSDHVARATRPVEDFSYPSSFTRATDQDYATLVDRLMAERPDGPLHIFAYGSLIWNPAFAPVVQRRAVARGWHREFCMQTRGHRGTPETPGLMMALMSGGRCVGLALEVAAGAERQVLEDSCRREFPFVETMANHRWLRLDTAEGPIRGLVFWAGPSGPNICRSLPLSVAAAQMARACGPRGSTAEYLHNTVCSLEEHGIRDRNLWTLQRLVAEEIDTLVPSDAGSISHGSGQAV